MASRVTAILEAKDSITPELLKIRREMNQVQRSIGGFDRSSAQMSRNFGKNADRMQRDIQDVRRDLSRLGGMKEQPKVVLDDQASKEITGLREKLMGLGGLAVGVSIGSNAGDAISEIQAAFRERALYAAKGKTQQDILNFDQKSRELMSINPFQNRAEAMSTYARSEQLVGASAAERYAETASKLGVTTRFTPEEHLNMMAVMGNETGVKDATRLGNAIQYMSNNLKDFRDEFVDSMIEYSTQTSKFLDTPEKMAALVGQIGKMGIWSDDKAFDALKESTLKLTNQGDLANVLKTGYETQGMESKKALEMATKEAAEINKLIHSENRADNQAAMGRMMVTLSTIQDKNVRQQVLNELGAGPGEDLGEHFAPLLEYAGSLATGAIKPNIGNELDKSYQAATQANELFEYQKAQNEAKQSVLDLGTKVAQDVTPAFQLAAEAARGLADKFNAMPDWARHGIEWIAAAGVVSAGAFMLIRAASMQMMAAKMLSGKSGGGIDMSLDKGANTGTKAKNKRGWNPKTWFGGSQVDKSDPTYLLGKEEARLQKKLNRKERWGWLSKLRPSGEKSTPVEIPSKGPDYSSLRFDKKIDVDPAYKEYKYEKLSGGKTSGFLPETASAVGKSGGLLSSAKGIVKRVPLLGAVLGAAEIASSDNKLETAGRVGTQALGGWGGAAIGAATGAAVGSVVPLIGTAIGGAVGGIIGGIGGSWGADKLFDKAKRLWTDNVVNEINKPVPADDIKKIQASPVVLGPPVPKSSPAKQPEEKPKLVSLSIPSMPITLKADGVLQDVAGMLRLLRDPSVSNEIKRIIEKALLDALETRGGAVT